MIIFTLTIAGGNSTALVSRCDSKKKAVKMLLKEVEQIGFASYSQTPKLTMMGGELCINATLAFASQLGYSGKLYTSGIKNPVLYKNNKNRTTINVPLKYKIKENIILFKGIGFICLNKKEISKSLLRKLAIKYDLLAFGAIIYNKNKITPYVYVKEVDSFVKETACGSGSIAFSIFSGFDEIIQPTGKSIKVKVKKDKCIVSAEVNEVLK